MSTLFLHVGKGKTGSSYLQSCFGINTEQLHACGIHYPSHRDSKSEVAGNATSGNGKLLLDILSGTLKDDTNFGAGQSLLFSREQLAFELVRYKDELVNYSIRHGFDRIEVLYFTRDPIDHASTSWAQKVKFDGMTDEASVFFESYDAPACAQRFITSFDSVPNLSITMLNYSRLSQQLLKSVCTWLDLSEENMTLPAKGKVNRSLTQSELELQLKLNKFVRNRSAFIAYRLCNSMPEIKGGLVFPSQNVQQKMLERLVESMDFVDARLPEGHQYSRQLKPETRQDKVEFTRDQLSVIAQSIGWEMQRMRNEFERPVTIVNSVL